MFEYIARVDENFIILEVADLQSIYVDEDSGEEFALVWTRNSSLKCSGEQYGKK